MRHAFLVIFTFSCIHCSSQSFKSLSRYEKCWAITHPFAALKVKKISKKCFAIYNQKDIKLQLDTFSNGGLLDAFRHSFFMAAYAQKVKVKKLRKLGIAHEKANYRQFLNSGLEDGEMPDSLSSVMDLRNNETGLGIGKTHQKDQLDTLEHIVITEIKNGSMLVMKRNKSGAYLDCNGDGIGLQDLSKQWQVPKCLIASNSQ